MKNQIFTIILIIVFVVILFFINNVVNEQTNIAINNNSVATDEAKSAVSNNEEDSVMEIMSVSNENFEEEVLKSDKKVLIDFYADWCGPCKMLSPIVEQVASENDNIKVVKIDIDSNEELAVKYGVSSIPTLVVVENGETQKISVGLISKSEVEALVK